MLEPQKGTRFGRCGAGDPPVLSRRKPSLEPNNKGHDNVEKTGAGGSGEPLSRQGMRSKSKPPQHGGMRSEETTIKAGNKECDLEAGVSMTGNSGHNRRRARMGNRNAIWKKPSASRLVALGRHVLTGMRLEVGTPQRESCAQECDLEAAAAPRTMEMRIGSR